MMSYIYIIVIFWSGILIAWSAVAGVALGQIMTSVHSTKHMIRRTDISNFIIISFTGIAQILAVFIFSDWLVNLSDTALIANTWYTLYLGSITYTNISAWPILFGGGFVRSVNKPVKLAQHTHE